MIQKRSFKEDTEVNDVTKLDKAFQSEITFITRCKFTQKPRVANCVRVHMRL